MTRRIRVMHDYGCWPLWVVGDGDPGENLDPLTLGLSASVLGRLTAWQSWGDSRINLADPHDSRLVHPDENEAFDREGRLLAERIAVELPEATVTYWRDGQ